MEFFSLIFSKAKHYKVALAAILVLQTIATMATLYLPSLNARIIDEGVALGDITFIWRIGAIMLAVAFIQVISACIAVWFSAHVSMGTGRDIRKDIFSRVTSFSAEDMSHYGAGTLITRGTNDVQQVQMSYMMLLNLMVPVPIMMIGGIIMAIREDPGLSWLMWVSMAVLLVIVGGLIAALVPMFQRLQPKIDRINSVLREQITGIRVVRAFTREEHESQRFDTANRDLTNLARKIGNLFVLMFPLIMLILNLATAAVMWFGGQRVDAAQVQVGALTAFLQYLLQILAAVMMGAFMAMMAPRAIICARRIQEIYRHEPSITEPTQPTTLGAGTLRFDDVSFSYPGAEAPVLSNISFELKPNKVTAIIGSTGAGKTTLLNLIPRLYAPTTGRVLIDDVNVADIPREQLAQVVSMVPQKPYLFSGTVRSNLLIANSSATEEEMWRALNTAQASFVDDLDMPISQGGTNVSGGQRQRLCIARALVAQPKIYLFDDSFSALDVITDAKVRQALSEEIAQAAMIIVAQRVSSIMDADEILVLEAGEIIARGTHQQLLDSSPTYQEIVRSQMEAA